MTDPAMTTVNEPDGAPRIASLDILRGIAILGILFLNINDMGASLHASLGDVRHLGWSGADQVAYWLRAVFANGTARCLLELLFGAGMAILTDRAAAALADRPISDDWLAVARGGLFGPGAVLRPYYWRNVVLLGFGLVHVFVLLWPGDILHTYGIAALIAFLFRRLPPGGLMIIGLMAASMQVWAGGASYLHDRAGHAAEVRVADLRARGDTPPPALRQVADNNIRRRSVQRAAVAQAVAREDAGRTATIGAFAGAQWRVFMDVWLRGGSELAAIWEAASVMLLGVALYRWGILQGRRSRHFYRVLLLAAYAFGLGVRTIGTFEETRFDGTASILAPLSEYARIATTLGHVALIQLLLTSRTGERLLQPFAAAGRTALSLYVLQTLIGLWLLYSPIGLGLYGTQGWMALMLTALAINVGLLVGANLYVRRYRIAPVEWAWRSLIAGRRLSFDRG